MHKQRTKKDRETSCQHATFWFSSVFTEIFGGKSLQSSRSTRHVIQKSMTFVGSLGRNFAKNFKSTADNACMHHFSLINQPRHTTTKPHTREFFREKWPNLIKPWCAAIHFCEQAIPPTHKKIQINQNCNTQLVEMLLRFGADVNHKNVSGNTPLHYAMAYDPQGALGEMLISRGADDTMANNEGLSCYDGLGRSSRGSTQ